jgi:hypothetical protein
MLEWVFDVLDETADNLVASWCWLGGHDIFSGRRLTAPCSCPSIWVRVRDLLLGL